ncbi:MAG: hypothetical protein R3C14_07765 [Caldilineaceae bacterium]
MWYITTFQPVSLISLKLATATSTGGKSLLLPTPYALKMAVLAQAIQQAGVAMGQTLWPSIRDANVALVGPEQIAVTNTFTKILKPMKGKPTLDEETGLTRGMINTIGFREYVQWQGVLQLAFAPSIPMIEEQEAPWSQWLTTIQYVGKRGGFMQAIAASQLVEELPATFTRLDETTEEFTLDGTLQLMDDCAPEVTFEQVDIYSGKNMRTGKDRLLRPIILPYRVERSSRGYTLYRRVE